MADEPTIAAAPVASPSPGEAAGSPAPVAAQAPAQSAEPSPSAPVVTPPVEAPVDAITEKPVEAPAEAKPAEAPVEAKPADAPAEAGEKPAESAPAVEAPKGFEFNLPETVKADPATMAAYNNVLGKYGISQEAGQELIDFHANAMKQATEQMSQHLSQNQQDVWAETQKNWVAEFDKSAGNRRDTILNDAKFAITDTIKDAKQRKALWDVLAFTGAGNHKDVINGLAAIGKRLRERSAPSPSPQVNGTRNGTPADRRYGGTPKSQGQGA